MSGGAELIAVERARQYLAEGYDDAHDAQHDDRSLLIAAFCYIGDVLNGPHAEPSALWPWAPEDWKPTPADIERQLVKAGALIAAEIDRRAARDTPQPQETP